MSRPAPTFRPVRHGLYLVILLSLLPALLGGCIGDGDKDGSGIRSVLALNDTASGKVQAVLVAWPDTSIAVVYSGKEDGVGKAWFLASQRMDREGALHSGFVWGVDDSMAVHNLVVSAWPNENGQLIGWMETGGIPLRKRVKVFHQGAIHGMAAPVDLTPDGFRSISALSILALSDNGFALAMAAIDSAGRYAVLLRRYDAEARPLGGEYLVTPQGVSPHSLSLSLGLARRPGGGWILAWWELQETLVGITAQAFDAEGLPIGPTLHWPVGTCTTNSKPRLTILPYPGDRLAVLPDGKAACGVVVDGDKLHPEAIKGSANLSIGAEPVAADYILGRYLHGYSDRVTLLDRDFNTLTTRNIPEAEGPIQDVAVTADGFPVVLTTPNSRSLKLIQLEPLRP